MRDIDRNQSFAALLIHLIEARGKRAVEIQHSQNEALLDQRHDELGSRSRVAGDVAGKIVDIRDEHASSASSGGTADPLPDRDADTGGLALEWA